MRRLVILLSCILASPATKAQSPSLVTTAVDAPGVQFRTFDSVAAKTKISYHLYTPEAYETETSRRFPVLYWLHGTGGGLKGIAPLSAFFDEAIREGKIPPMLVVFPNGLATSMWCDSKDGAVPMETIVVKELIPHIDATLRTVATREGRLLEGFSMGGYGAARLGFKHPQLFGAVSILAGGPLDLALNGPRAAGNPAERERLLQGTYGGDLDYFQAQSPITVARQQADAVRGKVRVRIVAGARDNTAPLNRAYSDLLKQLNIAHTLTIVPDAGHDTLALFQGLGDANWEFYHAVFPPKQPQPIHDSKTPPLHHSIAPLLLSALCALCGSTARAQTATPDRFSQLDKNSDGKLTQEEFPYPFFFKKHDKDGDGMLSREEAAEIKPAGGTPSATPSTPAAPAPSPSATASANTGFKPRPHGEEATKAGLKPDVLAKLDIAMQQAVANQEISGVIGLIQRNGERGCFEAFGWQDIEAQKPLAKDALFRLQSMTKPVIAACAMSLYDEGNFTLAEPISKHCPEWAEPKVLENGQLVPAKFAITPRMLMSHGSGLYYGDIAKGSRSKAGNEGAKFTPVATTSRDANTTLKTFSEGLAKAPLKFHPGTSYQYGHSIDVLGRYIEAVAGKPLDEVLKERILGPLKMTSTDFWVHPENAARICQIYKQPKPGVLERGRESSQLIEKPTLFLGGHGLFGTIGDYERLCLMILNRGGLDGVRVLKPETVDLIFENHLKHPTMKYGLGGIVNGAGSYGWGGADGTQFVVDRSQRTFTLFMVQTQHYKAPTYPAFLALANEA